MRDVVACGGILSDEGFDLAQHPVDTGSKLIEWIIFSRGSANARAKSGYDTLNSPVDLQEPLASTQTQCNSDGDSQRIAGSSQYKYRRTIFAIP